jgi:hypothetical protein
MSTIEKSSPRKYAESRAIAAADTLGTTEFDASAALQPGSAGA